jgi:hypothetical protein
MERTLRALAVLLLLAFVSCNPSQVKSNAKVTVDGAVKRHGAPVSGVRVALGKEASAGDVFFGVVSIGLSCLEQQFSACKSRSVTTASTDGTFAFSLKGSDTQDSFGDAAVLDLVTALPRTGDELAGPGLNTRFQVQAVHVTEPLNMWEPNVSVAASGGQVLARWTEPPASLFPPEADLGTMQRSVVFQGADAEDVWTAHGHAGGAELDARLLEDSTGGVVVFSSVANIKLPPARGTDVEVQARSARYAYASRAGVPASRGKPCSVPGPDGKAVLQSPCTLTDGRFGPTFAYRACSGQQSCAEPKTVTFDLGRTIPVTLIVVRGCGTTCTAEASTDNTTWRSVGTSTSSGQEPSRDVAMPVAGAAARFVRITSDGGLSEMREVSIWDHEKAPTNGSMLVTPESVPKGRLTNVPPAKGGTRWLLIVAAIAVAIALALAGFALGRRRGARAPSSASSSPGTP